MTRVYVPIDELEKSRITSVLRDYGFPTDSSALAVTRNTLAFVNKIYKVIGNSRKYILRESRPGTKLRHIRMETELLEFLRKNGFALVPTVIANKQGGLITYRFGRYFTLQTFVSGRTVANWDNLKNFNLERLKSFFAASGRFSHAVKNFLPHTRPDSPQLADYVEAAEANFRRSLHRLSESEGINILASSAGKIIDFIRETKTDFSRIHYRRQPTQLVHFDLHPGNVNFSGNQVSGIFDLDWIRFDCRATDIAATIAQSCYHYGGKLGGHYRKDRIRAGLRAYRTAYGKSEFGRDLENHLIKIALKGYLVFQLLFVIDEYAKNPASRRHVQALEHFVKLVTLNDFDQRF